MRPSCVRFMKRRIWGALAAVAVVMVTAIGIGSGVARADEKPIPKADFRTPTGAVVAFLAAAKAKDPERLAQATALRAPTEAEPRNQALFTSILEQSLSGEDLARLASLFEGYQVVGTGQPNGPGRLDVYIEKPGPDGSQLRRRIRTRKEKAGWKVLDLGETWVREGPAIPADLINPENRRPPDPRLRHPPEVRHSAIPPPGE